MATPRIRAQGRAQHPIRRSKMRCRTCHGSNTYLFLPLGKHPAANAFLRKDQLHQGDRRFPLDVVVCLDCGLIQVANRLAPEFFRNYLYVPSASDVMVAHFAKLAQRLIRRCKLTRGDFVVDIGSNNGTFLRNFAGTDIRVLGIEPAANLAALARKHGVATLNDYFSAATAHHVRKKHGPAAVISTTNTFNHIDDLHGFMEGVAHLLAAHGTFVVEVPHALDLIRNNEFDTVYHEHLSQFTVRSVAALFAAFDMEVFDIERLPIHGGSMRLYGRRKGRGRASKRVEAWLSAERRAKLFTLSTYARFATRVHKNKGKLQALLRKLKQSGYRIAGYGAPAKGNTLLNYYRIGPQTLDYLVDRSSLKHGLYSPGMHIPIYPVDRLVQDRPDYVLLLAWNFTDEILRQQHVYRSLGGRFILPIPQPRILA